MKRISSILLNLFLAFSFGLSVLAEGQQSAVITATVPSEHTVTINSNDKGDVLILGNSLIPNGSVLTIARGTEQEYIFRAKSGYRLESVLYNGRDITAEVEGGRWVAPMLTQDSVLMASFGKETNTGKSTRGFTLVGQIMLNGAPLAKTTLNFTGESGTITVITDENGKYRLDNITAGFHSLTVTSAGNPVGYVEFNISEASISNVKVDASENGSYEVTVDGSMKYLEFNFGMQVNGKINIAAQSISFDMLAGFPNTGDQMGEYLLLFFLISGILLTFMLAFYRKRKE